MLLIQVPSLALRPWRKRFTTRRPSSLTRRRCIRLSPIVQYSPLLPPVGVGPCLSPVWPVTLSGRLPVVALVGHYPTNKLIGRGFILHRQNFQVSPMRGTAISGIRPRFQGLSESAGQITHVLLTRSPLITTRKWISVRLACVKHAASVRPEPGSNSSTMSSLIEAI